MQEELYSLVIAEVDRDKGALGQLWLTEAEVITPSSSYTDTVNRHLTSFESSHFLYPPLHFA